MKRKIYKPNIVRGGGAIPLGNNYYYMIGRKHKNGGIDIGKNDKTGLEVEDGEVIKINKDNVKVYSSVPFLNGKSPAQKILNGENPNKVFNQQERFKYVNNLNDDGTKKALGGDGFWDNLFNKVKGYFSSDDNKNKNNTIDIKNEARKFLEKRNLNVDYERKLPNDSPTKEESEAIERDLRYTAKRNQLLRPESKVYDIPYIYDKEIKVNGAGRVSSNTLDSIAVNLNKANKILKSKGLKPVSLSDAIGLPVHETKMGAMPAYITSYRHKINNSNALYNTSIFRNYGNIPAAALVMNHEYYDKGYKGSKYDYITNIESPLAQAYVLYGNGLYNTGDKSHTQNVKSAGQKAMQSKDVINWMKKSNYAKSVKKLGGSNLISITNNGKDRLIMIPSTGESSTRSVERRSKAQIGTKRSKFVDYYNQWLVEQANKDTRSRGEKTKDYIRNHSVPIEKNVAKPISKSNNVPKKVDRKIKRQNNRQEINDKIGLASNIIGAGLSNIINRNMLNNLRYTSKPIPRAAVKLNTNININPQLDKLRETLGNYERDVNNNTASSRIGLARKQLGRLNGLMNYNSLYGQKENMETQLVNQDKLNQQGIANQNITEFNTWRNGKINFDNTIAEKKSENNIASLQNINAGIQDMLTRREQRNNENQTIAAMILANPNLPIDLLEEQKLINNNVANAYRRAYRRIRN